MGRLFWIVIVFFACFYNTSAQEKTFEHVIVKGENVYVIAKRYGVKMNDIFRLNPGSEDIIYAGRTLLIPEVSQPDNTTSITNDFVRNYEVKYGETKSGLSRRFGVSIASLEQQNPHIVRMLQAGHVINVDKNLVVTETPNTISNQKGEHFVNKGETLWGIARRYGISLNELIAANSDRLSGVLKAEQTLLIPEKNPDFTTNGLYIVKRGDTKYQLAKRFNTTIAQLESDNPQIVEMLQAGHRIDVTGSNKTNTDVELNIKDTSTTIDERDLAKTEDSPDSSDDNTTDSDIINTDDYVDYVIKPKETLFSLSQRAGMTIDEFTKLNPQLKEAVLSGAIIKMPKESIEAEDISDSNTNSTGNTSQTPNTNESSNNDLLPKNENTELITKLNTETTNGIYFYLPFDNSEFDNRINSNSSEGSENVDKKYYDFYKGATIAIDSAKVLGLNFSSNIIKKDANQPLSSVIEPDDTNAKNAIIIPFLNANDKQPDVVADINTSVIGVGSNLSEKENNYVYEALIGIEDQKVHMLEYLASKQANIIVISDLEKSKNQDLITSYIPGATFLKVDRSGTIENQELTQALDSTRKNYVIYDSNKLIVFLNSTNALMRKISDYQIQLAIIDPTIIPNSSSVTDLRFRVLKTIFPSIKPVKENIISSDFALRYNTKFIEKPSDEAIIGFDTTFDIILRISQNGSFKATADAIDSQHVNLKFKYKSKGDKLYYNKGVYIMQYSSGKRIVEIE